MWVQAQNIGESSPGLIVSGVCLGFIDVAPGYPYREKRHEHPANKQHGVDLCLKQTMLIGSVDCQWSSQQRGHNP